MTRNAKAGRSPRERAHRGTQESGEQVYQQIAAALMEQRLAPGTKLGEEQLGEIFGVSRPVVRWALMRLAHEALVELRPHRGAFVASPTPQQAREVFEARAILEEAIVRRCAAGAARADLPRLEHHLKLERRASAQGARARWIRLSGEFHILLAEIAGNQPMTRFLEDLVAQTSLIIGLYGNPADSLCCEDEHARIVKAIEAGQADEAVDLMLRHLKTCEAALRMEENAPEQDLEKIFSDVRRPGRRSA